jgi:hypothetical protein
LTDPLFPGSTNVSVTKAMIGFGIDIKGFEKIEKLQVYLSYLQCCQYIFIGASIENARISQFYLRKVILSDENVLDQ